MDQDATYRKLTRIPLKEMEELIDIKNFREFGPPVHQWNEHSYDIGTYWKRDLEIHRWRVQKLTENGWTFEEFFVEVEKKNIQTLVNDFNAKNTVPADLLTRVRMFFPNATIVPAKLELE